MTPLPVALGFGEQAPSYWSSGGNGNRRDTIGVSVASWWITTTASLFTWVSWEQGSTAET